MIVVWIVSVEVVVGLLPLKLTGFGLNVPVAPVGKPVIVGIAEAFPLLVR